MNYLTNYYKNLCEQRQEQIRILEQQLAEGERWDKFKRNLRGELENLGNFGGALVKLPGAIADKATSGGLSRAVASTQRAVAGGLGAAARGLGKLSASAESGAKQSEARAREMDIPARAADQHLAEIQAAFQRRLPEIAQSVATDIAELRDAHVHRAYSDRNWEQAKREYKEPQFKVKKNATEEERRAAWWAAKQKADEAYQKSEKAADETSGKEFDKLHAGNLFLGRLASNISRLSSKGEGDNPPKLSADAPAISIYAGTGGPFARKASEVDTEVLAGGWSTPHSSDDHDFVLHPDVIKYNKWWESEGRERGAAHPHEIWHHGVQHVDERFEHLLDNIPQEMLPKGMTPRKLRALNVANRAAATRAFQRANEEMTRLTTRGREAPIKMMESKKQFLNNKIKYLLESNGLSKDDVRKQIQKITDHGIKKIMSVANHPNLTREHQKALDELDDQLTGFLHGARGTKDPEELQTYVSDAKNAVKGILHIVNQLGSTPIKENARKKFGNKVKYLPENEDESESYPSSYGSNNNQDEKNSKYSQRPPTQNRVTPPQLSSQSREEARIAERSKVLPHLGPGFESHEEFRNAIESWDEKSGKPHPADTTFHHSEMNPNNIHLATQHELQTAESDLELQLDSRFDDFDDVPDHVKKDQEKLNLIRKQLK